MSRFTAGDLRELRDPSTSYLSRLSAVAHIDLDAFYAQCEQIRLNLPSVRPVVCRQWNSVIAVGYSARKFGVKRGMLVDEVSRLCPEVVLAHVATFKKGEINWRYSRPADPPPNAADHKVSLDPYRRESRKIFKVFKANCEQVEKGGIDEAFMDLGPKVWNRIGELFPEVVEFASNKENRDEFLPLPDNTLLSWVGVVGVDPSEMRQEPDEADDVQGESCAQTSSVPGTFDWDDTVLMIASGIVRDIRTRVYDAVQYTCSAGIGRNRYVAKLASAKNKPNNQTVVPSGLVNEFLATCELGDVWGMGGKLGEEIAVKLELPDKGSMKYIRDTFSYQQLEARLGSEELANRVFRLVRGTYASEISTRTNIKSMLSVKQFPLKLTSLRDLEDWMRVFAADIAGRLLDLDNDYSSTFRPQTIGVCARQANPMVVAHSKQARVVGLMLAKTVPDLAEQLFQQALKLLNQLKGEKKVFPCSGLSMTVSNIGDIRSFQTVDRYFAKAVKKVDEPVEESLFVDDGEAADQPKDDDSLFVDSPPPSPGVKQAEDDAIRCERCNQVVSIEQVAEHSDWHYAKDLDEATRPQPSHNKSTNNRVKHTNPKKRKDASVLDMLQNKRR